MTTKDLINQTKQLIAIQSTADRPEDLKRAVAFMANIVSKSSSGITIERFEQNGKLSFLAYKKGKRPKKFDILLSTHVDVVPGKPEDFKPHVKQGRLYGRGALDMKGTAVVLANLFSELVNTVPYSLGLQVVSDEELGGYDGARTQVNDYGVRADFVVAGEYANDRHTIYNAARGLCWATITFKGKSAHSGHLWNGENAVLKASSFAAELLKRYPTPDRETWTTTANIASLSTPNETINRVPDQATLQIDFRFTREDPAFQSRANLEALIAGIDPGATLSELRFFEPAVSVSTLSPYVQGLSAAIMTNTGEPARYLGRVGASDGRHFAPTGSEVIEFGLYGQNSHANEEYVELASFEEYYSVMHTFLQKPLLTTQSKRERLDELAASLDNSHEPARVWYVGYGSGLSTEIFACQIQGGEPAIIPHTYRGCSNKTLPERSDFIALPHRLYFAGTCTMCGGGHATITPTPAKEARTIARAHLIAVEQFSQLAAEQTKQDSIATLPFRSAMEQGYATIPSASGYYDTLVFCGLKDDIPMFAITAGRPQQQHLPPSPGFVRILCDGLSENTQLSVAQATQYVLATSEVSQAYEQKEILGIFRKPKQSAKTPKQQRTGATAG